MDAAEATAWGQFFRWLQENGEELEAAAAAVEAEETREESATG